MFNEIYVINIVTTFWIIQWKDQYGEQWNKGLVYRPLVFIEKPLHECISYKEQDGIKWSTVDTHNNADCLFNNVSIKQKYFVNLKLEHFCDKICMFLQQDMYIYVGYSFLWNIVELILLILSVSLEWKDSCVKESQMFQCYGIRRVTLILKITQNLLQIHTLP